MSALEEPLLTVSGLKKYFRLGSTGLWTNRARWFRAVDGVDFELRKSETLALVGESGAGKTTVALCVLGLLNPTAGSVRIWGTEISQLRGSVQHRARRHLGAVFQDSYDTLDPRMRVCDLIGEPFDLQKKVSKTERAMHIGTLLARVGLAENLINRLPRELSGGQRQRVAIARALAMSPSLLVLDEPLTFLDVLAQERILRLLCTLQSELGLSLLLITHDLLLARACASRIAVMYGGRLVESASSVDLFLAPQHPYTRHLLATIPRTLRGAS